MNYNVDDRCKKEIKALGKKHRQLAVDLETFVQTHQAANDPGQSYDYRRNFFSSKNAAILHGSLKDPIRVVKARLHSTDLKDKSLRVIYLANGRDLTLIEIYSKSQKPTEDKRRWQAYK
ncbi:hypothetical protein F4X86_02725 [Candidatus Saccharibacteria bacterium]|nr:hypothetical protein [Candidatus Saccharibacteria bacterium]